MTAFWRPMSGGVSVFVTVQPRSRRPGLGDVAADRLRIGASDAPEDGRANRAACAALAEALGLPAAAVALASDAASRRKMLRAPGDPALLASRLEAL